MVKEIPIRVPPKIAPDKIISIIAGCIADSGLTVTMRATLKSFAGSTHWHLKRGRERGTLELTWWPTPRKLWMKIQAGRAAEWTDDIGRKLKRTIESRFQKEK